MILCTIINIRGQRMKVESQKKKNYFLNSEFSFNKASIITNFLHKDLETLPKSRLSQNFDLGSR